jgi:hypothetical protein
MAFVAVMIVALIWLVPLVVCLAMVIVSWISPRFKRVCVYHLFGPEQPGPDAMLRPKEEGVSSPLPSMARASEPYASPDAGREQGGDDCYAGHPGIGSATKTVFRVEGSIVFRSRLPITPVAASSAQDWYRPGFASRATLPCKPSSWVSLVPFC